MLKILILSLFFAINVFANSVEFTAYFTPLPGNFVTKTDKVKGVVKKVGESYVAENIIIDSGSLSSDAKLRDKHMKDEDRLDVKKFPEIILVKAEGKKGKGSGRIKIKGVEVEIPKKPEVSEDPTYEIKDGKLIAKFCLLLDKFPFKNLKHLGVGVKNEIKVRAEIDIEKEEKVK